MESFFSRYLPSEFASSENPIMPKSALARKNFLPSSLRARKPLNEHPVITPQFGDFQFDVSDVLADNVQFGAEK